MRLHGIFIISLFLLLLRIFQGGPTIAWRPGRIDGVEKDCTPDGRLPDGAKGPGTLLFDFFNLNLLVVLLLLHFCLSKCQSTFFGITILRSYSGHLLQNGME